MPARTLPSFTRAVNSDSLKMFQAALAQRVDVDAPAPDGWNALHRAVHDGKTDWVQRLLDAGANPNRPIATNSLGRRTADTGDRPVHLALSANQEAVMRLLVAHGADLALPNGDGDDLATFAAGCDPVLHPLAALAHRLAETRDLNATLMDAPTAPTVARPRL